MGWNTISDLAFGNIGDDNCACANNAFHSNSLQRKHGRAHANMGESTDLRCSTCGAVWRKMGIATNPYIMLNDCACVDDHTFTNFAIGI